MPSLAIRTCAESDYAAIAAIYNQSIAQGGITLEGCPLEAHDIKAWVDKFNPRERLLVAEQTEQVVGWGIIKRYSDRLGYRSCCETSIYLDHTQAGKGYGSHLQTALLETVVELGYHHVVVKILASNLGSIEFHRRFGFEPVGLQKEIGFQRGSWHDIMIMQLILPHVPPHQPELG